ncbi:6-phospho-3-hexuloisomerase, partial [Halomonas marinisediminis]
MTLALDGLADRLLDELRPGLSAEVLAPVATVSQALAGAK